MNLLVSLSIHQLLQLPMKRDNSGDSSEDSSVVLGQTLLKRRRVQWQLLFVSAMATTAASLLRLPVVVVRQSFRSPVQTTAWTEDGSNHPYQLWCCWWLILLGILVAVLACVGRMCVHNQRHSGDSNKDPDVPALWHHREGRIGNLIALLWLPTCFIMDLWNDGGGSSSYSSMSHQQQQGMGMTLYLITWSTTFCWMQWYIVYYNDKTNNQQRNHDTTWPNQCRLALVALVGITRWSVSAMGYLHRDDDWITALVCIVVFVGMGVACEYVAWYGPTLPPTDDTDNDVAVQSQQHTIGTWIVVLWAAVAAVVLTITGLGTYLMTIYEWTALLTPWCCSFFVTKIHLEICWKTIPNTKRPRSARGRAIVIHWFWHIVCTLTILLTLWTSPYHHQPGVDIVDTKHWTDHVSSWVVLVTAVNLALGSCLFWHHYQHGFGPLCESKMVSIQMRTLYHVWVCRSATHRHCKHIHTTKKRQCTFLSWMVLGVYGVFCFDRPTVFTMAWTPTLTTTRQLSLGAAAAGGSESLVPKTTALSKNDDILIVPAEIPQDLPSIQACRAQAFDRPLSKLMESQQNFVNATTVARGRATCWLARRPSGLGGYDGIVWGTADVVQKASDGAMSINNVFVTPDARGQGLAKRLLAAIEQDARSKDVKLLTLEVYTGNTPAYSLYLQTEFTTRGIHNVMAQLGQITGFSFLVRMEKDL